MLPVQADVMPGLSVHPHLETKLRDSPHMCGSSAIISEVSSLINESFNYPNLCILPHRRKKNIFWSVGFIMNSGTILCCTEGLAVFASKGAECCSFSSLQLKTAFRLLYAPWSGCMSETLPPDQR